MIACPACPDRFFARGRFLRLAVPLTALLFALAACESGRVQNTGGGLQGGPPAAAQQPARTVPLETAVPPPIPAGAPAAVPAAAPKVAILLPLTGPSAQVGRALLDAAQVALFDIGDDALILLPRDTGGTADGAARAAEAALADGARLIIGPLFAAEVAAVTAKTRAAGINVVSLSNDRAAAGGGAFVLGISPQTQIERVVGFARTRGLRRFAALVPANSFGAAVEEALRATAARADAQVGIVERYDPATTDASPVVRRLAAYEARRNALVAQRRALEGKDDEISREALRRLEGIETVGEIGFDSVLLPDFGDRLLAISPLLPYYDIDPARIRFLGTALWEDPRVGKEPALIGAWFAAPPPQAREGFVKRFHDVYGREPPRIATLAYDAVALAAVLARAPDGPDFSAKALTAASGFAGLDGIFRLRADGTAERGLAVLEVRRDGFRTVSPAPETFEQLTR